MKKNSYSNRSLENLKLLAKELSYNYFHGSTIDIADHKGQTKTQKLVIYDKSAKWVFDKNYTREIEGYADCGTKVVAKNNEPLNYHTRNILVIGAGATTNSFKEVPLAGDAIKLIYQSLQFRTKDDTDPSVLTSELIEKVSGEYSKYKDVIKNLNTLENPLLPLKDEKISPLIIEKFFEEFEKLNLYSSKYGRYEPLEFETALSLLSKILPVDKVRDFVQNLYKHEFGPTLSYEVIAHLFKHRFIDVIINFNFDELLDRALDDELGKSSFDKIISDGDCPRDIAEFGLSKGGRLRQPLYIKPHGTASHKSTLRFTKDHYFEMPPDMKHFLRQIIKCEDHNNKKTDKKVNFITLGFEMGSVQFNNILRTSLPKDSQIFSFYYHDNDNLKVDIQYKNRLEKLENIFKNANHVPIFRLIGHEFFKDKQENETTFRDINEYVHPSTPSIGNCFNVIYSTIQKCFKENFQPRNISNHKIIDAIFGKTNFLDIVREKNNGNVFNYFNSHNYFADRILIEILFELSTNNGRIDPHLLMRGRVGSYFYQYFNSYVGDVEIKKTLNDFIIHFQKPDAKSINLKPLEINTLKYYGYKDFDDLKENIFQMSKKNSHFSGELKDYFDNIDSEVKKLIFNRFKDSKESSKSTLQIETRNFYHHIFKNYNTSDLITTDLSMDLYFYFHLKEERPKKICVIADYGVQVCKFIDKILGLNRGIEIFMILCDSKKVRDGDKFELDEKIEKMSKEERIDEKYENFKYFDKKELLNWVKIKYLPINRHNHHMTIFLDENNVSKNAIYYYQQGLSKRINPIQISEPQNIKYLKDKFRDYSSRSYDKFGILDDDEWIDLY